MGSLKGCLVVVVVVAREVGGGLSLASAPIPVHRSAVQMQAIDTQEKQYSCCSGGGGRAVAGISTNARAQIRRTDAG